MPKPRVKKVTAKIPIDWDLIGKYLQAGLSGVEISGLIGIHENTLYLRCKEDLNLDFVAFKAQKRAAGDGMLLTKQFDVAMKGDKTMLVWLGKQRLNQSDKSETKTEHSGPDGGPIPFEIEIT